MIGTSREKGYIWGYEFQVVTDDYTTEFYQLIARNDVQDTEEQLVARYFGGLWGQIKDSMNMLLD